MKRISLGTLLGFSIIISSCGKSITEVFEAPKTKDQAGLIASCTTKAQANEIAKSQGIRFRVINEKRKIVEFFDIDKEDLQKILPTKKIKSNVVYEHKLISGDFVSTKALSDYPFYGSHTPQYRDDSAGRYFPHLEQIDGLTLGSDQGAGVTIAIIDTGVYYNHPHLSPNIKVNSADKHGNDANNFDDDNNGYNDDYAGWDFYNGDAYPLDDNGHGTHVAGLSAGTLGGIAPKAKILPVKVLSSEGRGDLGTIAAGIMYAIDMGADIINLSLGGPGAGAASSDLQALLNSVTIAEQNDALIIAAAGNGGTDGIGDCNDQTPIYPANIDSSSVIAVAAVSFNNEIASYSNFGTQTVHVAAPGGDQTMGGLVSTGIPYCQGACNSSDQSYKSSTGTSMATPIVSGLAALIKSKNPNLSHSQIKQLIMSSGTQFESLIDKVRSGQVINVAKTMNAI
jgi:subtilisin family serine protease